jgi:uncharacterized protein (TIGR02246 family)
MIPSAAMIPNPTASRRRALGDALGAVLTAGLGAGLIGAAPAAAAACAERDLKPQDPVAEDRAIRDLIGRMQAAWNRGDFRGYMEGFANPDVVFVSGGRIKTGWQDTLDHYIQDYGAPGRRGELAFSDIQIDFLAPDAAQLISHYRLDRALDPQDGINTRLMRKRAGRWVIALNHVSSKTPGPVQTRG